MTVSGLTIKRTSVQRDQRRRRTVQKSRSTLLNTGGTFPLEDSELLSECQDFHGYIVATQGRRLLLPPEGEEEFRHNPFVTRRLHTISIIVLERVYSGE